MPHSRTSRWSIRRWTAGPSERYASAAETAPHVGFSATCVPPRRPRRRSSTPSATRETRARRTVISPTSSPVSRFPHTRMAVFPELRLCGVDGFGPETHEELHEIAEPLDGPRVKALAELAGDLGLWLLPSPVCERGPAGTAVQHRRRPVTRRPPGGVVPQGSFPGAPASPTTGETGSWSSTSPARETDRPRDLLRRLVPQPDGRSQR